MTGDVTRHDQTGRPFDTLLDMVEVAVSDPCPASGGSGHDRWRSRLGLVQIVLLEGFNLFELAAVTEPFDLASGITPETSIPWETVGLRLGAVTSSLGTAVRVNQAIDDTSPAGTVIVLSGDLISIEAQDGLVPWLKSAAGKGCRVIGIGDACLFLAEHGLLLEGPAAIHWSRAEEWRRRFPQIARGDQIFSAGPQGITCSGGRSSLDLAIHLIRTSIGIDAAKAIADRLNCDRIRVGYEAQRKAVLGRGSNRLRRAMHVMSNGVGRLKSVREVAGEIHVSNRQLQRLFKRHGVQRPTEYFTHLRLEQGRRLLSQTTLTIAEISSAVGFKSTSHFSRRYKMHFGTVPSADR